MGLNGPTNLLFRVLVYDLLEYFILLLRRNILITKMPRQVMSDSERKLIEITSL